MPNENRGTVPIGSGPMAHSDSRGYEALENVLAGQADDRGHAHERQGEELRREEDVHQQRERNDHEDEEERAHELPHDRAEVRDTECETTPALLVWCADLYRIDRVLAAAGATAAHDNIEEFVVAIVDVTLAAAHAFIAAEALGLGGVMIGGLRNDPATVTRLLDLPELVFPIYGMCLGYPAEDPGLKPRLPRRLVLHDERYDRTKVPADIAPYDVTVREYYRLREMNARATTWTSEMMRKFAESQRPYLRRYLDRQGFRFE